MAVRRNMSGEKEKTGIIGLREKEIRALIEKLGYPPFHGTQVFNWIYHRFPGSFLEMTDLPKKLRYILNKNFTLNYFQYSDRIISRDGHTIKYKFPLSDSTGIESVTMKDRNGRISFCISSQCGCEVGCLYCTTGTMGLVRNLTSSEIVNQILCMTNQNGKPDSILFMGMGEPLLNYDNLLDAMALLKEIGYGVRRITISTCGIVKNIYRLANSGYNPRLAVSIGSAIEEKRKLLIPGIKTPLEELKEAIKYYRKKTGRRVTIEYTIIKEINDSEEDARALANFASETKSHVNIIRFNRSENKRFEAPTHKKIDRFKKILIHKGIEVSERYRRGNDISAACGQLIWNSNNSRNYNFKYNIT